MPETILAAVAWPYANSDIHVGNLTGSYLPADIFTRYHRLAGNRVLMVSGSDSHGTAITLRADTDGTTPNEVYKKFHRRFLDLFEKLGLQYDLFTSTHTENHFKVSQAVFCALRENGYLYVGQAQQWFSPVQNRFLADRYVEGTCYICGFDRARGDQCDNCGNLLDATLLVSPRSTIDGTAPELRETEHFYLDLKLLQPAIEGFLKSKESYWRPNVLRQSLGQIQAEGLHGRAISRDLDWGIPVPVEGWTGKCIYVWFEAVIGYLSATIEWASLSGEPESWKKWWQDPSARSYYFIGKDNIPFHAVIWPGQLYGAGDRFGALFDGDSAAGLNMPYDIPANEFMNLEGQKISGSRNWAVYGLDFLSRYDPDPLRFYLTLSMPETRDTDWDWNDFIRRNNDELVATWGNLANRVLSFAFRNWDGRVPEPGELRAQDRELLDTIDGGFVAVGELIEKVRLRAALTEALRLAAEVNRYLDQTAPWFEIKENKEGASLSIYSALRAVDSLKILFAPFLPFSSEKLHRYLGYSEPLFGTQVFETSVDALGEHEVLRYRPSGSGRWVPSSLSPGTELMAPEPLFRKLEPSIAEEERSRLG
ncbi:MAG TPA: methionine--tRNA ligase [Anaerolineales bacterium]|nr:methionine--tRNA ligase [Anaerolineales bacterium]